MDQKKQKPKPNKKQKISFLSAVSLVVGSSIGAGIFFKNQEILSNTQGNIALACVAWIVAIIGIIAMGLTLMELCSGSGSANDLGIIGWIKTFNNKYLYYSAKNFMAFLYLPINFFIMPFYAINSLQSAFPNSAFYQLDWYWVAIIAYSVMVWFMFSSGLSAKMTNIQNWVVNLVKFFPILFAILIGYIILGIDQKVPSHQIVPEDNSAESLVPLFNQLSPWVGVFICIPSVFFVFDGFYATASIQTEMKEPKKVSSAMLIGLVVVAVIDLAISLSITLCTSDGSIKSLEAKFSEWNVTWIYQTIQIMISIGVFGIINGFAIYNSRYYQDLIKNKEIFLWSKLIDRIKPNSFLVGCLYSFVLSSLVFWISCFVGAYAYLDINGYSSGNHYDYQSSTLMSFVDLMANWTSVIVFLCICMATFGALKNMKTKKIKTINDPKFKYGAYISISIVSIAIIFVLIQTFANVILVIDHHQRGLYDLIDPAKNNNKTGQEQYKTDIIGSIMQVVSLFIFIIIMFIPSYINIRKEKKHGIYNK